MFDLYLFTVSIYLFGLITFVYISIYLLTYLLTYMFIYLFPYLFMYSYIIFIVCLFICPSICPYICLFVCQCICLFICLHLFVFICIFMYLCFFVLYIVSLINRLFIYLFALTSFCLSSNLAKATYKFSSMWSSPKNSLARSYTLRALAIKNKPVHSIHITNITQTNDLTYQCSPASLRMRHISPSSSHQGAP